MNQRIGHRLTATRMRVLPAMLLFGLSVSLGLPAQNSPSLNPEEYLASINDWRTKRHERLSDADGWMTLVGLEWLQEGANRVGSGSDNDIVLAGGPEYWGTVFVEARSLRFVSGESETVTVDGASVSEIKMLSDEEGTPTRVRSGSLSFYPIWRETYALRVKDTQSPVRLGFDAMDNYDIQPEWRIEGRLIPAEEGATIEIANVQGQIGLQTVVGTFEFEKAGKTHRLLVQLTDDPPVPWVIFNDRTNSNGTYGAGRYLYLDEITENHRVIADFNKAYNPPCAFTEYATCPIPPQENRLDLAVTAGEKDFHVY